jgi:hypothetical protein
VFSHKPYVASSCTSVDPNLPRFVSSLSFPKQIEAIVLDAHIQISAHTTL